jgi:hypothetical protein
MTLGLAATACNRGAQDGPVAEKQELATQAANQPMTVAGCLKAGEAAGTFMLSAGRTTGGVGDTANYQLVGAQTNNLQDHVGYRVEVNGTMQSQQEIATTATPQPAANERATGTSGTPTVQTKTEVDIRRLSVSSVKRLGDDKCEM